jgi:hypothetical protein
MCLEGMLTSALSQVPVLKYFSPLISFTIFVTALYYSMKTGSFIHMLVACCCPLLYLIYHFATNGINFAEIGDNLRTASNSYYGSNRYSNSSSFISYP